MIALPLFTDLDRHFAAFVERFGGSRKAGLAAACLSRAIREGHICLDLALAPPPELAAEWLPVEAWREELLASRAVAAAAPLPKLPEVPLILDARGRLYLRRYYLYEQELAAALRQRAACSGGENDGAREGQEAAIAAALQRRFSVISGGPGTGKTTTVVKILTHFILNEPELRIALAAPTGKAAARMEEALHEGIRKEPELADQPVERLPRAVTLDKLLGSRPNTTVLRHHARNPLPVDLLVVDEASMVALPLMAKLFAALPESSRVILLGDRDQLASVAPGNVLADLADAAQHPDSPLHGSLTMLTKNYRFGNESTIYRLCEAIRKGDSDEAVRIVHEPGHADLAFSPLPPARQLSTALRQRILEGYGDTLKERDPAKALEAFNRFRILAALRQGPFGVESLNNMVEGILREAGWIGPHRIYAGMPILITQNDHALQLRNGDIGILLPNPDEPDNPSLWAWFPSKDAPRRLPLVRLPEWEKAYSMTVHKSQGSEFDEVLLILPDYDVPLLTRELVYTGVTRAKHRVELWANETLLKLATRRRTERNTGLRDALIRPLV